MSTKKGHGLTKEQIKACQLIRGGADIYNRSIAVRLREVQRDFPSYIVICPAKRAPHGARQQPFFGATLTHAGVAAITPRKIMRSYRQQPIEVRA